VEASVAFNRYHLLDEAYKEEEYVVEKLVDVFEQMDAALKEGDEE